MSVANELPHGLGDSFEQLLSELWIAVLNHINTAWYVAKAAVKYISDGSGQYSLSYLLYFVWVTIANLGNALNVYYHIYMKIPRETRVSCSANCLFIHCLWLFQENKHDTVMTSTSNEVSWCRWEIDGSFCIAQIASMSFLRTQPPVSALHASVVVTLPPAHLL